MAEPISRDSRRELMEHAERLAHNIDEDYMLVYGLVATLGVESAITAIFFWFL